MNPNVYLYILVMAVVTYLIRLLPLAFIQKEIKNTTIRSFLYYVPYVTLAVMTFPAILTATSNQWTGFIAFITAIVLAYRGCSLFKISITACAVVFILELFL
jgi:branched-subunit amino acid transport protein